MNPRRHTVAVVVTLVAVLFALFVMPYAWLAGGCGLAFNLITVATFLGLLVGFFALVLAAVDAREDDRMSMMATALASIMIVLILGVLLRLQCL